MNLKKIIEKKIYSLQLDKLNLKKKCVINTINPHSYCISKNDALFSKALLESDILLPDGSGIVMATKLLTGRKIKKIAGFDIHQFLLKRANNMSQKVFYMGGSQNTLELIRVKIKNDYPNIKSSFYSPPFKSEFSEIDSAKMCEKINAFKPDILFVGMTAPKQEKWTFEHKDELNVQNICCVGAVFDFYAGNIKRSSPFWIKLGLEWFPRFIKEPKRLFKRNFVSAPKFILEVLSFKLFGKGIL